MRRLVLAFCLFALPVSAHEFWLEPHDYQLRSNDRLTADLVNGQNFNGNKLAFLPQRFAQFVTINNGKVAPVVGRIGDQPAMDMANPGDGLTVVVYQARNATVDYETWEKFQNFVTHKDLGDMLTRQRARGLPEANFKEVYSRYSKSLVAVGSGAGSDTRTGMTTEIVALTNPYTDNLSEGMRLQLYYNNAVRANSQIEIFAKSPDGTVTQRFYRTDANGIAAISVQPGHSYMADAVVIREPGADLAAQTGAVWETLWANMTWAVPG